MENEVLLPELSYEVLQPGRQTLHCATSLLAARAQLATVHFLSEEFLIDIHETSARHP